uniref:Uncharacterized protein n=1 Tax=Clytia hemisphaerica TaxID=252671 RepID=A0A7M5UQ09_9CNID
IQDFMILDRSSKSFKEKIEPVRSTSKFWTSISLYSKMPECEVVFNISKEFVKQRSIYKLKSVLIFVLNTEGGICGKFEYDQEQNGEIKKGWRSDEPLEYVSGKTYSWTMMVFFKMVEDKCDDPNYKEFDEELTFKFEDIKASINPKPLKSEASSSCFSCLGKDSSTDERKSVGFRLEKLLVTQMDVSTKLNVSHTGLEGLHGLICAEKHVSNHFDEA